jgi:hypothetical protein
MFRKSSQFSFFVSLFGGFMAGLVATLFNSMPAYANPPGSLPVIGDQKPGAFTTVCPTGDFMVGLMLHSGTWVDQLSLRCAPVGKDGTVGGQVVREAHGGSGGGVQPNQPDTCAQGSVVSGMQVSFTPNSKQVRYFLLECRSESSGAVAGPPFMHVGSLVAGSAPQDQTCPPGQLAVGLNGNSGNDVNAVGLICAPNPKPVTTATDANLIQACKNYAAEAISDVDEWTARGCSPDVANPNRFGNNYQGHYDWCISLGPTSQAAANEEGKRQSELNMCRTTHALPHSNPAGTKTGPPIYCADNCVTCQKQNLTCSSPNNNCKASYVPAACY